MDATALEEHCRTVLQRMRWTMVVPFLGAGANLCGAPAGVGFRESGRLPSGGELAEFLAEQHRVPYPDRTNLGRVSQFVELFRGGEKVLYEELRRLFTGAYEPNDLHRLLAALPALLRDEGAGPPYRLIVTTNYDDLLEQAFQAAGEPYELLYYAVARRDRRSALMRVNADGRHVPAQRKVPAAAEAAKPIVILKIHGAVDRELATRDSYVITEDDYIDYLAVKDVLKLLPTSVLAAMSESNFLFLGYGMRDWNLRVVLHRIWEDRELEADSWAIEREPDELDRKFWNRRNVEIVESPLEDWVACMRRVLAA
jgi:SIR2-like domain